MPTRPPRLCLEPQISLRPGAATSTPAHPPAAALPEPQIPLRPTFRGPRSAARPPWTSAPGPRPSECPTATSTTPRWSSSASTTALPEGTRARRRRRTRTRTRTRTRRGRTSRGAAAPPTGPSSCSPVWSPRASSSDGRCSSPSSRHTSRYSATKLAHHLPAPLLRSRFC